MSASGFARWGVLLAAIVLSLVPPLPALAHKLKLFATVEGTTILGRVYFAGDPRVKGIHITVLGPAGERLAEAVSGEDGRFAIDARERVDHHLVADSGDGHQARFVVRALDLSPALPERPGHNVAADTQVIAPSSAQGDQPPAPAADIEALVDRAVARHVRPLAERLVALEETLRWRDVLGGLGYIVGVTGVACYVAARRRG